MAVTASSVRLLHTSGSICRDFDAGGTVAIGDAVYLAADGDVERADANAALSSQAIGIVIGVQDLSGGVTEALAGDRVTVCLMGAVSGFSSLTPGALQYVSETAGAITGTAPTGAGTWTFAIGYAESAGVLIVQPGIQSPSSNS